MTDTDRRTANFEALYRWVISDPRPLPSDVAEDVERLYALAGFTWADVDTCRYAAEHLHHYGLVTLADRLEALLPARDALPPR